jgi:hypothetical protein
MAINYQAVGETLSSLKGQLEGLRSSISTATPEQRKQLSGAFDTLGSTLSSTQARVTVDSAKKTMDAPVDAPVDAPIDPLFEAQRQRAQAEARAKEADAKRKEAEAVASISDQRLAKSATTGGSMGASTTPTSTSVLQELLAGEPQLADYGLTADNVTDPMVVASLRYQAARETQIAKDVEILNDYVAKKEQRVRDQVALIDQSIANQSEQLKVEQRKRMSAVGMAGMLSNRSLYSPEEHQGLIQEVVQEGILQLQEIQIEGYKLQNEMWEDFEDFEFEAYTQKSEILKEFNKLELDTVTAIQERLQAVAEQEREKQLFDHGQMERSSLILAEELVDASDEAIRQVAEQEGIDYGMLLRAVRDAKFTQDDRELSLTDKRLSIAGKRKSLTEGSEGGGFSEQEINDINFFAQELIDNPDGFKITSVPSNLRAAVIARRNELEGDADAAKFIETAGESFIDWVNEDKKRSKFVKKQFADNLDSAFLPVLTDKAGSNWITPRGVDVRRAIQSNEGQVAVQIAIEQGARTNEEIYEALFGEDGIVIEYVNEQIEQKKQQESSVSKSANSTPAFK